MMPALYRILIYARDMQKTASFYERYFGFTANADADGGIIELVSTDGGANILIHQAAKSIKLGPVMDFQADRTGVLAYYRASELQARRFLVSP